MLRIAIGSRRPMLSWRYFALREAPHSARVLVKLRVMDKRAGTRVQDLAALLEDPRSLEVAKEECADHAIYVLEGDLRRHRSLLAP